MGQKPIDQSKLEEAKKLFQSKGYSATKCAKEIGISKSAVLKYLRSEGLIPDKSINTDEIRKLYSEWESSGKSMVEFCKEKGIWRYGFTEDCRKVGLYVPVDGKKQLNNTVFDAPLNEESAYWLGMLLSDGYISKDYKCLEFGLKDKEHVEKFRRFLKSQHKIEHKITSTNSDYYRLVIHDDYLCSRLRELGIENRKTYNLRIVSELENPDIARHFIRGFVDGDGHIVKKEIGITSYSIENLKVLENYMNKYFTTEHTFYYQQTSGRAPKLCIYTNRDKFADWLYSESSIYLDRKYQKYLDYFAVKEE